MNILLKMKGSYKLMDGDNKPNVLILHRQNTVREERPIWEWMELREHLQI